MSFEPTYPNATEKAAVLPGTRSGSLAPWASPAMARSITALSNCDFDANADPSGTFASSSRPASSAQGRAGAVPGGSKPGLRRGVGQERAGPTVLSFPAVPVHGPAPRPSRRASTSSALAAAVTLATPVQANLKNPSGGPLLTQARAGHPRAPRLGRV